MLFSLPFLSHRQIASEFDALNAQAQEMGEEKLTSLFVYVKNTWLSSNIWKLKNISVYQRLVRANNDTEGYHYRLNKKCGNHPPFYKLLEVLYSESNFVNVTCKLVSCRTVLMHRRKKTAHKYRRGYVSSGMSTMRD